jgi:uncharacterized SAM-binding protein YcdF (DUF218 family)
MPFTTIDFAKFIINPLIFAFLIILVLLIKRNINKRLLLLLFLYLYIVTVPCSSKLFSKLWSIEDTISYDQTYDAVVAMTGIANSGWYLNRTNSHLPLKCYYHFGGNVERIVKAAELLRTGHAKKLLLGDLRNGSSFSEAELLVDFLEKQGIGSDQIVVYGETKNTLDEAEAGLKKLVLITSESHMRRAAAMFNKHGLHPALLSVSRNKKGIGWRDFIPGSRGLSANGQILYEIVGYAGYFIRGEL